MTMGRTGATEDDIIIPSDMTADTFLHVLYDKEIVLFGSEKVV